MVGQVPGHRGHRVEVRQCSDSERVAPPRRSLEVTFRHGRPPGGVSLSATAGGRSRWRRPPWPTTLSWSPPVAFLRLIAREDLTTRTQKEYVVADRLRLHSHPSRRIARARPPHPAHRAPPYPDARALRRRLVNSPAEAAAT